MGERASREARSERPRCWASVHDDHGVGFHQCLRRATVERDGKPWCATHDPEAVAAKRAKWNDKYEAKQRANDEIQAEAERLSKRLGVHARAHYDGVIAKGYTRAIVIAFEDADALAKRLGQ